mmetsp:Transcript_6871/g.14772  ORF Transcript_6871/g.14772 Transcript_6871/m.14772 type:complete len:382 (+) Transcript_6871:1298-2443(+)
MVDLVVQQSTSVDAAILPPLGPLSSGPVVLEDTGDHSAVREAVAAGADDLTVMPQPLELGAVRPVEGAVTLQVRVVELALEPGPIREHLLTFPLNAIVLELPLVPRPIGPCQLAVALTDVVLPLPHVLDSSRPSHSALAVHSPVQPPSGVNPPLLHRLKDTFALLFPVLEITSVLVSVGPSAHALAVEDAFPELTDVRLPALPGHGALTPHHVLAPLPFVGALGRPHLLALPPHVPLVELSAVLAAIAPDVVAFPVHAAVQPLAVVGVAVGKDPLVRDQLVSIGPGRSITSARGGLQHGLFPGLKHLLLVDAIGLHVHHLIREAHDRLPGAIAGPRLVANGKPGRELPAVHGALRVLHLLQQHDGLQLILKGLCAMLPPTT